jgi:hypothetical protein
MRTIGMNAALLGKITPSPQDNFSPGAHALAKVAREDVRARTDNPDIHTVADWMIDSFADTNNATLWAIERWLNLPVVKAPQFAKRFPRYMEAILRLVRMTPDVVTAAVNTKTDRELSAACDAAGITIYAWSVIAIMVETLVADPRAFAQRLRDGRLDLATVRKFGIPANVLDGIRETFQPLADTIDLVIPSVATPATPPFVAAIQPWPIFTSNVTLGDPRTILMRLGSAVLSRAGSDRSWVHALELIEDAVAHYRASIVKVGQTTGRPLDDHATEVGCDWVRHAYIFGMAWAMSGFPLLRPTHKLAASLMATHVPKDLVPDIKPPFPSFLIEVPEGIVPSGQVGKASDGRPFPGQMSSLPYTDRLAGLVESIDGLMLLRVLHGPEADRKPILCAFYPIATIGDLADMQHPDPKVRLLARLVLNCALELEDPRHKHAREGGPPRPTPPKKVGRPKDTLPTAWTFELRREVKLDARAWVGDYITSKGTSPSVQTLVRGHWKRQPFGPRVLNLRRSIHIEPYWRGPEDAPIVTRPLALAPESK